MELFWMLHFFPLYKQEYSISAEIGGQCITTGDSVSKTTTHKAAHKYGWSISELVQKNVAVRC